MRRGLQTARTVVLTVASMGCATAAAWRWNVSAGLAVAAVSLAVLEWLTHPRTQPPGGDR